MMNRKLRIVLSAVLGAMPGALLTVLGWSTGEAIAAFGALIGAVIAWQRLTFARFLSLVLVALFGNTSFGPLTDTVLEKSEPERDPARDEDPVTQYMTSPSKPADESLVVVGGLIAAGCGAALSLYDAAQLKAGRDPVLLNPATMRGTFGEQAALLIIVLAIWGAALAGLFVSRTYRRWIVVCGAIAGVGFGLIGVHNPRGATMAFGGGTLGIAFGMMVGWLLHRSFNESARNQKAVAERASPPVRKSGLWRRMFDDDRTYTVIGVALGLAILTLAFARREREVLREAPRRVPAKVRLSLELSDDVQEPEIPEDTRDAAIRATRLLMGAGDPDPPNRSPVVPAAAE